MEAEISLRYWTENQNQILQTYSKEKLDETKPYTSTCASTQNLLLQLLHVGHDMTTRRGVLTVWICLLNILEHQWPAQLSITSACLHHLYYVCNIHRNRYNNLFSKDFVVRKDSSVAEP